MNPTRIYLLTIRMESGAIWRQWRTTSDVAAMTFATTFNTGLWSKPYSGEAIPDIQQSSLFEYLTEN